MTLPHWAQISQGLIFNLCLFVKAVANLESNGKYTLIFLRIKKLTACCGQFF